MYIVFLKWFIASFIVLLLISYSIVTFYIGFDKTFPTFFEGPIQDKLMLLAPSIVVSILLTKWQLKNE